MYIYQIPSQRLKLTANITPRSTQTKSACTCWSPFYRSNKCEWKLFVFGKILYRMPLKKSQHKNLNKEHIERKYLTPVKKKKTQKNIQGLTYC